MSRTRPPRDIRDRRDQNTEGRPLQEESVFLGRTISRSLKILAGAVTLIATSLGIVTAYLSLIPRISVSQTQPLDPADPFSAQFIVSNDGPLGINDVAFDCAILNVNTLHNNRISTSYIRPKALKDLGMEVGEKATVPCVFRSAFGLSPSDLITSGDISIVVRFRPDFVFWEKHRSFRFRTIKAADGTLYWFPQPYDRLPKEPPHQ